MSSERREINEGLPAIDPAKAAQEQAANLQGGVASGAAAGAAVGGGVGALGGPAALVGGSLVGAVSGAHEQVYPLWQQARRTTLSDPLFQTSAVPP